MATVDYNSSSIQNINNITVNPNKNIKEQHEDDKFKSAIMTNLEIIENNLNIGMTAKAVKTVQDNMINKFNRFKIAYPDLQLSKTFAHIFFVRPILNLYDTNNNLIYSNDPIFSQLDSSNRSLLRSLTKGFSSTHDFNPFLSNMADSFETKDESIKTMEYGETYTGYKIKYGKNKIDSETADDFSIQYTEDYDYRIYKIHKAWVEYISKASRGEIVVDEDLAHREKILDYATSVYYFLCGPDGETILFWTKYIGVFPTNIPSSEAAWQKQKVGSMPETTIQYSYAWKEDYNPLSLYEFNVNAGVVSPNNSTNVSSANMYEPILLGTGRTFVNQPYVIAQRDGSFKLKFKK